MEGIPFIFFKCTNLTTARCQTGGVEKVSVKPVQRQNGSTQTVVPKRRRQNVRVRYRTNDLCYKRIMLQLILLFTPSQIFPLCFNLERV